MLLVALVSLVAVPVTTWLAERSAYAQLPDDLRRRVELFSRPESVLPNLLNRRSMPMMQRAPSFQGEAARLAVLVRDLREMRRDAVWIGVAAALAASVALAVLVSRQLARPIEAVSRAASQVASGRLDARADLRHPDRVPQEVRDLAQDFDAMAASLERLEAERTSMIADVAHELRNPLATLSLRLEAAADGIVALDRDEASTLLSQTHLLTRLVNDLRTLSQADAGRLTLTPVRLDLRGPLGEAAAAHRPAAERADVRLVLDAPTSDLMASADPDRLMQILHNLLENALRVAPEGSEVRLVAARRDEGVEVRVRDEGPGIAVDPPDTIFERFVGERRRDVRGGSGSGLGLSIVRTLVTLQGGTVFARREDDATEIGFTLPAVDTGEGANDRPSSPSPA
jgi:two-component system sensor histidine kinase BaeS